jgi:hypothetical protein
MSAVKLGGFWFPVMTAWEYLILEADGAVTAQEELDRLEGIVRPGSPA